jgi:hypothetical protein
MKLFRRSNLILAALTLGACERANKLPPSDSAARAPTAASDSASVAAAAAATWDPDAGPVLLIATDLPTRAFVLIPDSANTSVGLAAIPHPASVTLFGRNGTVQNAELPEVTDAGACVMAVLSAAPPPRPWNVGFIGGVVAPVAIDSIESLSHNDSLTFTIGATRLASALPNDSAGRFTGLPFVVRAVWRFNIPQGRQVIAVTLVRQINQEATPLQERTFLVAERSPADSTLSTVYSERSNGDEETVESREVLAAVLLGSSRNAALVLSHDFGNATAYALIERGDDGRWRARWKSPRRHC